MSLQGDLLMPPRGPLKWRWLTEMLAKLSKAAGILSPDGSVQINPTTGGVTLYTPAQPRVRIDIKRLGKNLYEVPDLFVVIELQGFDIPPTVVSVPNNYLVCIKIDFPLPVTFENIASSELSVVVIPISQLSSADAGAGLIYIPLAINENGFTPLAQGPVFSVFLYSGFRFVD